MDQQFCTWRPPLVFSSAEIESRERNTVNNLPFCNRIVPGSMEWIYSASLKLLPGKMVVRFPDQARFGGNTSRDRRYVFPARHSTCPNVPAARPLENRDALPERKVVFRSVAKEEADGPRQERRLSCCRK